MCVTFHLVKILPDFNECLKTLLVPKPRRLPKTKQYPPGLKDSKLKTYKTLLFEPLTTEVFLLYSLSDSLPVWGI